MSQKVYWEIKDVPKKCTCETKVVAKSVLKNKEGA